MISALNYANIPMFLIIQFNVYSYANIVKFIIIQIHACKYVNILLFIVTKILEFSRPFEEVPRALCYLPHHSVTL